MELASLVINGVSPSTQRVNLDPSCNHTIVLWDLYVVRWVGNLLFWYSALN
jgi:hypothetical protein